MRRPARLALQPRRAGVRHSAQQVLPGDGGSGAKWTVPVLSRYHAPLLAAARFAGNSLICCGAAIVPESVIEALRAAEDAEDAAEADASWDEPGESIPLDELEAEFGH